MTPPTITEDENDEKSAKPSDGTSRSRRTQPDDRAGNEPDDRSKGGAEPPKPGDAAVDPRFEARRAAVAQEERRRRRVRVFSVLAVLCIVVGCLGLTRSGFLDVDTISVMGWRNADRDAIVAASGIDLGVALTDVDTERAARRIEALVPWVAAARVTRSWPSGVRITVVERRAIAAVQSPDGMWLSIDASGHLLDSAVDARPGLKPIEGTAPGAKPGSVLDRAAARGVSVLAQMSPALLTRVAAVRFVDEDLEFVLQPNGTVAFGPPEQVQMKLLALETVLARVDQTCVNAIDVRVPRRPLVKRDPTCLAAVGR
ncbi:MAG: FtsQ-type POTRA domain-containing protein [Acidimicrobiales bacterium]|nr:FtsQ-type POTRA domain-containing protein [Acidimicrobiales bacterium]